MRSRQGFKALALFALTLGVMALGASVAQAADFDVAGTALKGSEEKEIKGEIENKDASLLASVNGLDLQLLCAAGDFVGVSLKAGGVTNTTGHIKFTGCVANILDLPSNAILSTECEPHTTGQPNGTILTEPGQGTLELHTGGVAVVLIIPGNAEQKFANVEMGKKCPFGQLVPIFGVFTAQDCNNEAAVSKTPHLINEFAALTTLTAVNKKAEHAAKIDGSANVKLATGENFAALAG